MSTSVCSSESDNNIFSTSGRCIEDESRSLSADVSESESSSGCFSGSLKSSSFAASNSVSGNDLNFPVPSFTFPVVGGNDDVMDWDKKKKKKKKKKKGPDSDLSGVYPVKPVLPMVGGHEGAGVVHSVGSAIRGDLVMVSPPSAGFIL